MSYDEVIRLALERGFYAPSCEIYSDAPAGFWNFGPLGTTLRNRFVELWRKEIVRRNNMMEIDGSQVMSKNVFIASGHLEKFYDPIVSCRKCGLTIRADRLISDKTGKIIPENLEEKEYDKLLNENNILCSRCNNKLGDVVRFNMMFKINLGTGSEEGYLRPETCQSIFVDFPRLFKIMRGKLPFSLAQIGKSFRNEIAPRQSLIRLREFYQAEIEIFFNPSKVNNHDMFDEIKNYRLRLMINNEIKDITPVQAIKEKIIPNKFIAYYLSIIQRFFEVAGINRSKIRIRRLGDKEKAFYAKSAFDLEVKTSIGWLELVACNDRSDYDLQRHAKISNKDMTVIDENEKILPNIFELSMGIDRSLYCILEHSITRINDRNLLKLNRYLAPIQIGVFPLIRKSPLPEIAKEVNNKLKLFYQTFYDESRSIGRRYRRMDEIGTPIIITIDFETLENDTVTIREKDEMKQIRVKISDLQEKIGSYFIGQDLFR